jgi:hypothetical protein
MPCAASVQFKNSSGFWFRQLLNVETDYFLVLQNQLCTEYCKTSFAEGENQLGLGCNIFAENVQEWISCSKTARGVNASKRLLNKPQNTLIGHLATPLRQE